MHHGLVVWLDVPVELLYARLASDTTRPLLEGDDRLGTLQRLFEQRQPLTPKPILESWWLATKKHPNNWQN
jgi:shikimate kinase